MTEQAEPELSSTFRAALLPEYDQTVVVCDIVTEDAQGRIVDVHEVHQSAPIASVAEAEQVAVTAAEKNGFPEDQVLWTNSEQG